MLQAHVTNLDASPYLGRLALCRIIEGTMTRNQLVAWCRSDGTVKTVKLSEMLMTNALEREPADSAGPGDIVAIAGIPDITIGETLSDPENPKPLPLITVDEPSISMTIGINTSPLAGKSGQAPDRPAGQGPARHRADRQRVDPGADRPSGRTPGRSRAAASCSWPSWSR